MTEPIVREGLCSVPRCPAPSSPEWHVPFCQAIEGHECFGGATHQHWPKRSQGGKENVACLCAGAHDRIDNGDWGNAVLELIDWRMYRIWDRNNETLLERIIGAQPLPKGVAIRRSMEDAHTSGDGAADRGMDVALLRGPKVRDRPGVVPDVDGDASLREPDGGAAELEAGPAGLGVVPVLAAPGPAGLSFEEGGNDGIQLSEVREELGDGADGAQREGAYTNELAPPAGRTDDGSRTLREVGSGHSGGEGGGRSLPESRRLPEVRSPTLRFESWRTQGRRLAAALAAAPWALGDWLVAGERFFGQDQVWSTVDELHMDYATLRNYQRVAEAFPAASFPRESFPWGWWREVAALPTETALAVLREASDAGEGRAGVVARRKEIEGVSAIVEACTCPACGREHRRLT